MRRFWTLGVIAAVVFVAASSSEAGGVGNRCTKALPQAPAGLPAPVVVTTRCGRFRLEPGGAVVYKGARTLPVPKGASYWMDLTWYRFAGQHLLIGRGLRHLWRSHDSYPATHPGDVGLVVLGRSGLSFSYFRSLSRPPRLYVARYGGRERLVALGESPVAWFSGRLVTWRDRDRALVLRGTGRVLVPRAIEPQRDSRSGIVVFRTGHRLRAFDGRRVRELARLRALGVKGIPVVEPLGKLVAVRDLRRLLLVDYEGKLLASAPLPKRPERVDGVSSSAVANADATQVAFTATAGNTAYGSRGKETVYLLAAGGRRLQPLFSEELNFKQCERMASLAWHGSWLLYSNAEQGAAVVDSTRHETPVQLNDVIARLPGVERDGIFNIAWVPAP